MCNFSLHVFPKIKKAYLYTKKTATYQKRLHVNISFLPQ